MTQAQKICKVLIARGKWTKANCRLCRAINKEKCPILTEAREESSKNA